MRRVKHDICMCILVDLCVCFFFVRIRKYKKKRIKWWNSLFAEFKHILIVCHFSHLIHWLQWNETFYSCVALEKLRMEHCTWFSFSFSLSFSFQNGIWLRILSEIGETMNERKKEIHRVNKNILRTWRRCWTVYVNENIQRPADSKATHNRNIW